MVGGIAINTAHELGHKRKQHEQWLSKVALAQTGYGHFFIEHNRGHHVRVATPEDPASSRLGESFWEFLPRTVWGSLTSALHLERVRLDRLGKPFCSIHNDVLNAWAMTVVLFGALTAIFGLEVLPWLLVQAVVGFSLLEVVNYLEHYGLLRQKREDGRRYERCRPEHSWNTDNVASNVFLYHLQRHSDHHANPVRRYQALRHFEELPELPSGYATMIVLAYAHAALAAGDGPEGARPLRRRRDPGQHPAAQARADAGQVRRRPEADRPAGRRRWPTLSLPGLRLRLRRAGRRAARGLPGRHAVERGARRLDLPRLRRAREGRLRAGGLSRPWPRRAPKPRFAEASRTLLRDTVLDAVGELLADRAWADVTMARGRRARRRQPPDALQRVRRPRRSWRRPT